MPIQAIESRRLYRLIADQLGSLIRAGEFGIGSRLPAERDLALQLGVSRPSVREALIALEVEGLVEVRMGSGIHVVANQPSSTSRRVEPEPFGPFEIIQARQVIECELAAMAAESATRDQMQGLRQALAAMRDAVVAAAAAGDPLDGDRLFHLRIAEAAANGPLLRSVGELLDARHNTLFQRLGQHFENLRSWREAIDEHQAIVDAIAAGRPAAARLAMRTHLQRSHDRFAAAWPQDGDNPNDNSYDNSNDSPDDNATSGATSAATSATTSAAIAGAIA